MADEKVDILIEREHEILTLRSYQLEINRLGWKGGRPYIDARLSRFAAESETDWSGGTRNDGSTVVGRKDRAYTVPYLSRIVDKINQYVFGTLPVRSGITPEIENDITSMGKSIDDLMIDVSSLLTVNGWCWIGIDAPEIPSEVQVSRADKVAQKIRPYAQVYDASQVVDWYINSNGVIEWLITESVEYIASNPVEKAYFQTVRRLWEPGVVTKITIPESGEAIVDVQSLSYTGSVPFVLVGTPSSEPHTFDSLESINRAILDLCSANFSNYYNTVYPQMYLPASVMDTVMSSYNVTAEVATTMIKGYSYPILLAEGDVTPGYMMPGSSDIQAMRDELGKLKQELFEATGLLLRKETNAAESAESKGFDFLDLSMLVRARSKTLQTAEEKLAKIMTVWDPSISGYTVKYQSIVSELEKSNVKDDMKEAVGLTGEE